MTGRRVRFTATARGHVRHFQRWWKDNSVRPEILHQDLAEAVALLSAAPGIGSLYRPSPIPEVRRFYLERLTAHLYYTFDDGELVVRALWHSSRGSGPDLSLA